MKKQLLLFLFALLPMLAMADDSGSCGSGVTWTYTESTKTLIIQGNGAMDNYSFDYGSSIVTTTAPWKNYVKQIKEVIIKDGVTSIGNKAFWKCTGLTSVTIPNSVTSIGGAAFDGCSGLTSITIPNSVTSINYCAFADCSGLTSVTIPNSVTSIGESAFSDCSDLYSVTFGKGITSVGEYAFSYCSNVKKVIASDVAAWCGIDFANYAANPLNYAKKLYKDKNTEITELTIPDKVTRIGSNAFSGCTGLTSITIPNSVTSIGGSAFYGCSGLTSVTIPNSVTSIGVGAFRYCSGLTSVTIPISVTSIGYYAFEGCSGLTSVTIPNSVTSIVYSAFSGCSGLTSVTIPNSVTSIGEYAFRGCTGLQSVYSKVEDVFTLNYNAFGTNTYNNAKLYVPVGKKAVYQDTPWWWSFTNIEELDYSTGIAAQQMGKDVKVVDAYQLNGLKRNGVQRGLNIVRMSDGTTRKVVVK